MVGNRKWRLVSSKEKGLGTRWHCWVAGSLGVQGCYWWVFKSDKTQEGDTETWAAGTQPWLPGVLFHSFGGRGWDEKVQAN